MYTKEELTKLVRDTLIKFELYSKEAEELILGTIAQESNMGKYRKQIGSGIARGICQMEPLTEQDIWANFLQWRPFLKKKMNDYFKSRFDLENDDEYAILMCRIHYMRNKDKLPLRGDVPAQAEYWKKHYNTIKGKGKVSEFIANHKLYLS